MPVMWSDDVTDHEGGICIAICDHDMTMYITMDDLITNHDICLFHASKVEILVCVDMTTGIHIKFYHTPVLKILDVYVYFFCLNRQLSM